MPLARAMSDVHRSLKGLLLTGAATAISVPIYSCHSRPHVYVHVQSYVTVQAVHAWSLH